MCGRHFSCWGVRVYWLSALANVTCSSCLGLRQWQRVYLSKWVMLIKVTSCVIVFVLAHLLLFKLIQHFFWNLCSFVFTFVSLLYVDLFVYFPAFLFCSSCSEVLSFYLDSTLVSCGGMNCVCDHFQVPWLLGRCIPSSRVDLVCAVVLVYWDSGVAARAWYLRLTHSQMFMRLLIVGLHTL